MRRGVAQIERGGRLAVWHETLPQFRWPTKLRSCATRPVPPVHTKKHGTEVRSMGMVMGIVTGRHTHTNFLSDNIK